MLRKFPLSLRKIVLAGWVLANLVLNVWAFHSVMEIFADFKIEMPGITMFSMEATSRLPLLILAAMVPWVILAAWGTARGEKFALWLALIFCALCDVLCIGAVLLLMALVNEFSSLMVGKAPSLLRLISDTFKIVGTPILLGLWSNQALAIALIWTLRKRKILRAPAISSLAP